MANKRILITAGGTGGHLYPAQALAQQLMTSEEAFDVLFVAAGLKTNRYFDRTRFAFQEIVSSPLKSFKGVWHLWKAFRQSLTILRNYQPDVVVGFGSYYTVPILLAAKRLKIPIVLHEANSIPGRANKWLAPLATVIGVHFPSSAVHFKGKTVEVGLPLREGYQLELVKKEEALAYYGLSQDRQILLIFGGSQGAKTINQIIRECLPLFQRLSLQIIHLTGNQEQAEDLNHLYATHQIPAQVKPFENQMQMAWRATGAFIGRSGASTVAESIEFEVPGIVIPYAYATDQHQEKNADFLVKTVGSAQKLLEPTLTLSQLEEAIELLYQDQQLLSFKKALKDYKQRPHQMTLYQLVLNTISHE